MVEGEAVEEGLDGVEADGWVGDGDIQNVGIRWGGHRRMERARCEPRECWLAKIARIREVSVELGLASRRAKAAT